LKQKELADLVKCSMPTIQAIEYGKLPLSAALAERIALETGVGLDWLLGNDVGTPPVDSRGSPVTQETFVETRAARTRPQQGGDDVVRLKDAYDFAIDRVGLILLHAAKAKRTDLYVYKLMSALQHLGAELGEKPCLQSFIYNVRDRGQQVHQHIGLMGHGLVDFFYGAADELLSGTTIPKTEQKAGRKHRAPSVEEVNNMLNALKPGFNERMERALGPKGTVTERNDMLFAMEQMWVGIRAMAGEVMAKRLTTSAQPSQPARRRRA
jgi:transcriptional regulator with XRE-family HTH domain